MALDDYAQQLHRLSFESESEAIHTLTCNYLEYTVMRFPALSPIAAYVAEHAPVSPLYLEFVYGLLELTYRAKYAPETQLLCIRIYYAVMAKLGARPIDQADFSLESLQAMDPSANLKLLRPRNLNDVLSLLGSNSQFLRCVALTFGPRTFATSPPALKYKYAGYYLRTLQETEIRALSGGQLFRLLAPAYAYICALVPRMYCSSITWAPAEIGGIVIALEMLHDRNADFERFLLTQLGDHTQDANLGHLLRLGMSPRQLQIQPKLIDPLARDTSKAVQPSSCSKS